MNLLSRAGITFLALVLRAAASNHASVNDYDPSQNILNIHVVPHTHDDVGWLKTVEQYYYGQNNTIRHACVSCILDSIVYALQRNPERKFTYVEMAFFSMWWEEQPDDIKQVTRDLVKSGQLAFVNGGWCMHDEASTHFMGMIDQTTLGHEFLKREFDYVPSVGWQLDPFGHSATQASLLTSEVGFNALYLGRIDYQDLQKRYDTRNCEGIWNASPDNLSDNGIFWGLTGSFSGNYGAPEGFCFDILCDDDPLYGMERHHLHSRMMDFMQQVKVQTERSRGNNIMLTMGSDFQYENAVVNFKSLDLLVDQINSMEGIRDLFPEFDGVKAFYSNPEIYTEYKYKEYTYDRENKDDAIDIHSISHLDVKTDDFFPYSDCEHCFWTGYFTSRPALKRLERVGSSFLQMARQVQSLFYNKVRDKESSGRREIELLEKAMAIAQHHDGVSGTSKQHVANDYAKKIQEGINEGGAFVTSVLKKMIQSSLDSFLIDDIKYCQLRNESICEISQEETTSSDTSFYIILYNALGQKRSDIVSVPVSTGGDYTVDRLDGSETGLAWTHVESSVVQNLNPLPEAAPFNLLIGIDDLSPVSINLIWIRKTSAKTNSQNDFVSGIILKPQISRSLRSDVGKKNFVINNGKIEVEFKRGILSKISRGFIETNVISQWGFYRSWDHNTQKDLKSFFAEPASGAYIFRPEVPDAKLQMIQPIPSRTKIMETSLVTEVHTTYEGSWIHQACKIYKNKSYVDVEYTVGPIAIADGIGKEVVNLLRTSISNNGTFYTDSNGREFLERKRSQRQTWNLEEFEPVAGNYYPVNAAIFIEDDQSAVAVLTDRTQGGASLKDGTLELMVHRRIVKDDSRGVGEALNETEQVMPYPPFGDASRQGKGLIVTGTHRIIVGGGRSGARMARQEMDHMFSPTHTFAVKSSSVMLAEDLKPFNDLVAIDELPQNVQLLTVKSIFDKDMKDEKKILLRLGHAFAKGECHTQAKTVNVDISALFREFRLVQMVEKTLTGNQDKASWDRNKMFWVEKEESSSETSTIISLGPMEVKTLEITLKAKDVSASKLQNVF